MNYSILISNPWFLGVGPLELLPILFVPVRLRTSASRIPLSSLNISSLSSLHIASLSFLQHPANMVRQVARGRGGQWGEARRRVQRRALAALERSRASGGCLTMARPGGTLEGACSLWWVRAGTRWDSDRRDEVRRPFGTRKGASLRPCRDTTGPTCGCMSGADSWSHCCAGDLGHEHERPWQAAAGLHIWFYEKVHFQPSNFCWSMNLALELKNQIWVAL